MPHMQIIQSWTLLIFSNGYIVHYMVRTKIVAA